MAALCSILVGFTLLRVHNLKKIDNTGEDLEDLISIGTIGLIKAIESFSPNNGTKLATFAAGGDSESQDWVCLELDLFGVITGVHQLFEGDVVSAKWEGIGSIGFNIKG